MQRAQEAVERAERSDHPYSIAAAYGFAGVVEYMCRWTEGDAIHGRRALEVAKEHEFPMWLGVGRILMATDQGEINLVADETLTALEMIESASQLGNSFFRLIAGTRLFEAGRIGATRDLITDALAESERSGEVNCVPAFHLLRGWVASDDEEREDAWKLAFDRSLQTGYRGMQVQVSVNLASLWHAWGRSDEAEAILASVLRDLPTSRQSPFTETAIQLLGQLRGA